MNSVIDTSVVVVFSVFIMLIGFSFAKTGKNLQSFFAGGKAVPWSIGGLSSFMSFFSAGTFVAWGSIAYTYGWVSVTIQWTMCIGGLIAGLYIAPRYPRISFQSSLPVCCIIPDKSRNLACCNYSNGHLTVFPHSFYFSPKTFCADN